MKRIILYIAASADGFIATPDGDLEWLTSFPNPDHTDYGYKAFTKSIDTVIMGGRTYREVLNMDVKWPYEGKQTYVVSRHDWGTKDGITFIIKDIIQTITSLRNSESNGRDIWLAGGGQLISMLLGKGLIDEMQIFYFPVNLGKGISLFPGEQPEAGKWKTIENKEYQNGVTLIRQAYIQS